MPKSGRIEHSHKRQAEYDPISKKRIADIGRWLLPGFRLAHELTEEFYEAGDVFFICPNGQEVIGFEGECRPPKHFEPLWHKRYSGIGIPRGKVNINSEWEYYLISHKTDPDRAIVLRWEDVVGSPITGRNYFNEEKGCVEWGEFYDVAHSKARYYVKQAGVWMERPED